MKADLPTALKEPGAFDPLKDAAAEQLRVDLRDVPTPTYAEHARHVLTRVAARLGIPAELVEKDASETNFCPRRKDS